MARVEFGRAGETSALHLLRDLFYDFRPRGEETGKTQQSRGSFPALLSCGPGWEAALLRSW